MNLTGLQPAQLQHVIQKAHQLGAGRLDPLQVFFQPFGLLQMSFCQGREAYDGVHGCAHIVGNIGQEGIPGISCQLRLGQGLLQNGGTLPLPADLLIHGPAGEHNLRRLLVGADVDNKGLHVFWVSLAENAVIDMIGFLLFQGLPNIGRTYLPAETLPVLWVDPAVGIALGKAGKGPDLQIPAKLKTLPAADPVGLNDIRRQVRVKHRLIIRTEALDQLQPPDQLVVHLLQEIQGLIRLLLELPLLLKLLLQNSSPLRDPAAVTLRDIRQEDIERTSQLLRLNEVAEILHPADGPVPPGDAVLHIIQVEAVLGDLLPDAVLHILRVLGMNHALEGSAGQGPELLLRLAAEHLEDGAVDVEDPAVVVPVDEEAPGHLVGEVLDLPGGETLPV